MWHCKLLRHYCYFTENTDYDTFGSIDSLIFEPKIPTNEDIAEAQEEIEMQFDFLNFKTQAEDEIIGAGKTTFAERVKLFQQLGANKKQEFRKQAVFNAGKVRC